MNAEIICITADSLPENHTANVTSYVSKKLFELGHRTLFETVCPPSTEEIKATVTKALQRSDVIILLDGVEPETNSVAKNALSLVTGYPLVAGTAALQSVKDYCSSIGVEPSPTHLSASIVIRDCDVYKNTFGLCVGLGVNFNDKKILLLPSAEGELTHMFETKISGVLSGNGVNVTRTVNVIGLSDSEIEQKLSKLSGRNEFAINIETIGAEHRVLVSVVADTQKEGEVLCSKAVAAVTVALGRAVYGVDSKGIQYEAVEALRTKGLSVATAESCTAGMISEMLTEVSGSSGVFEYGISAYSNRVKTEILKVPAGIISKFSAISAETAIYMAKNVREISGASIGVSVTGNAGPAPSEGKPVGMVFVAIADTESYHVERLALSSALSRDEIRNIAASTAINLIKKYAEAFPSPMPGMEKIDILPIPAAEPVSVIAEDTDLIAEDENAIIPSFTVNTDEIDDTAAEPAAPATAASAHDFTYPMIFDRDDDSEAYDSDNDYRFANKGGVSAAFADFKTRFTSSLKSFIPLKGDSVKKIISKVVFLVSLFTLILSSSFVVIRLSADGKQRDILNDAQSKWSYDGTLTDNNTFSAFAPFIETNEDIRGWLSISGAGVNNPVYQTTDNEFYLNHNMNKEPSRYGALFFDHRCNLSSDSVSRNLIIYGHEMKDGTMFGSLKKYKRLNFYKANPTITLTRLNVQETYKIFSVMIMNADPKDDNGYMYNYIKTDFSSYESFNAWLAEATERSLINTTVEVSQTDSVLTLVTCIGSSEFSNARLVIMARLTRPGEDPSVNVTDAALNPNPRYPQAWYDKRGEAGFALPDDTSDVTSSEADENPTASEEGSGSAEGSSTDSSAPSGDATTSSSTSGTENSAPSSSTQDTPSTLPSTDTPSADASVENQSSDPVQSDDTTVSA